MCGLDSLVTADTPKWFMMENMARVNEMDGMLGRLPSGTETMRGTPMKVLPYERLTPYGEVVGKRPDGGIPDYTHLLSFPPSYSRLHLYTKSSCTLPWPLLVRIT